MTQDPSTPAPEQPVASPYGTAPTDSAPAPIAADTGAPAHYGVPPTPYAAGGAPLGQIRGTGITLLLMIVTFGIYSLVYFFKTHDEMKRHSGQGMGGGLALVLALFVGFVLPFTMASEVGGLYERRGQPKPVSGATGLWYIPGIFLIVGPIVWFVKTNGALNAYWESQGAV